MASQFSSNFSPPFSNDPEQNQVQYTLNSKIMVAAIVVLFLVVLFILSLHLYAKWFWRRSSLRTTSWRRRHHLDFTGEEPLIANRNVGLDKAVIDSLPTFSYQVPKDEEEAILECAVCLSEFQEDEKGRLLPRCKHSFHIDCIDMWFHSHSTCPLCRTKVIMQETPSNTHQHHEQDTSAQGSSSPLPLLQNMAESHHHHTQGLNATSAAAPTADDSMILPSIPYPSNILFWGDHNNVSSQLSSPGIGQGGSSSTRSLPQITAEIPRRPGSFSTPRCLSLSLSRCSSVDDQAYSSQPLKSPSLRISIKRLLSRERSRGRTRVFPSDQGTGEVEQDTTTSLPV